jgi:hypothetical protein
MVGLWLKEFPGGKNIKIERGAAHWVKNNNVILDDAEYLKNFQMVKYEELVENPQETIMNLYRFIGLDPEKHQFNFQGNLFIHNIDDEPSPITNFNQKSFDRIPPNTFRKITEQIKPTMQRLGYEF